MNDLVSCLMITKNRVRLMLRSVRCFQAQSHTSRELIIVNDADDGTALAIQELRDKRIRYIRPERQDLSLGELRNLAVLSAQGDYVMQWDDDDWYHPDRIQEQLNALLKAHADVCVLDRWTLAWPLKGLYGWSKRRAWEGSMLAVKAKLPPYRSLGRGEDSILLNDCLQKNLRVCALDRPDLYVYVVHASNTWDEHHFTNHIFDHFTRQLDGEEVQAVLSNLDLPSTQSNPDQHLVLREVTGLNESAGSNEPTICVVIPVHNQAKYLYRAVTSVLWQMNPGDELIIVDDGSNDIHNFAGLKTFLNRILWLTQTPCRGVSYSRNRAISCANTDWIKCLDADDVLAPYALDIVRRAAIQPSVMVITGGCHRIHNGLYLDYLCANAGTLDIIKRQIPTLPSATFIRRSVFDAVGLFDERLDLEEDWDMWLRINETFGKQAFMIAQQPVCYYWMNDEERHAKVRVGCVDGLPVREYFRKRYGIEPQ